MAIHRLQFGINRQIGLLDLAAGTPHLIRLRFTALLLPIRHGWSSSLAGYLHCFSSAWPYVVDVRDGSD
jgi:hypothetical protein